MNGGCRVAYNTRQFNAVTLKKITWPQRACVMSYVSTRSRILRH